MNRKFGRYFTIFATIGLVSCGSSKDHPQLKIDTVSIYSTLDANQDSATAVDLVIVHDQELLKTLGKMSAKAYFAASPQLRLDNPTLLNIWHWELVPGQSVQSFTPTQDKGKAFGAYVFANYLAPGDHRLKVAPDGIVAVLLGKNDLKDYSALTAKDMNTGETMSNSSSAEKCSCSVMDSNQSSSQEICNKGPVTPPKPKVAAPCNKGPVTPLKPRAAFPCEKRPLIKRPCQRMAISPCHKRPLITAPPCSLTPIPSAPHCTGRKPMPIIVKPLRPLKVVSPCNSKRR